MPLNSQMITLVSICHYYSIITSSIQLSYPIELITFLARFVENKTPYKPYNNFRVNYILSIFEILTETQTLCQWQLLHWANDGQHLAVWWASGGQHQFCADGYMWARCKLSNLWSLFLIIFTTCHVYICTCCETASVHNTTDTEVSFEHTYFMQ